MILSRIVFPREDLPEKRILYYRGQAGAITDKGLTLLPKNSIRFDTYFGAFFYSTYEKYTRIKWVRPTLVTTGAITIKLFSLDRDGREKLMTVVDACGTTVKTELPSCLLAKLPEDGALFLEVTAHSSPAWLHSGWYETEMTSQRVKVAAVICTYHREGYLYRNLSKIKEMIWENRNCPVYDDLDLFVIDNGKSIHLEEMPHVFLLYNKNCGGSGGFARGMIEAYLRREVYTHVLLMDDDISFEPEIFLRTIQFLKAAAPTKRPLCVGGQMLLEDRPAIQFEAGASYINGRLFPNGQGLDLSDRRALLSNSRDPAVQYNAWWYCCIPIAAIEKCGFPLPLFIKTDDVEYGLRLHGQVALLNGVGVWHMAFSDKYAPYLEYYIKRNELIVSAIHGSGAGVLPSLKKLIRTVGRAWLTQEPKVLHFTVCAYLDFLRGPGFLLQTDGESLHAKRIAEGKRADQNIMARLFRETGQLIPILFRLLFCYRRVREEYQRRWKELTSEKFWRGYLALEGEGEQIP